MIAKENGNGNFEPLEPGIYGAICTRVVDLGTQKNEYKGEVSHVRQVLLGFEVAKYMQDGRPFYVMGTYTLSLSEKATLRKILEGIRGKAFTDEERKGFEMKKVLGAKCQLVIGQTSGGKAKIVTGAPVQGAATPQPSSLIYFSLEEFSHVVFESLGEWIKGKIVQSPEYEKAIGEHPAPESQEGSPASDSIPF